MAVASVPGPGVQRHSGLSVHRGGVKWWVVAPVFPDQVYAPLTAHVGDSLALSWVNEHNVVVMPARAPATHLLSHAQVMRLPVRNPIAFPVPDAQGMCLHAKKVVACWGWLNAMACIGA